MEVLFPFMFLRTRYILLETPPLGEGPLIFSVKKLSRPYKNTILLRVWRNQEVYNDHTRKLAKSGVKLNPNPFLEFESLSLN